MSVSGQFNSRRSANAKAFAAFGVLPPNGASNGVYKVIREGGSVTLFTIGYERRSGEDLMSALRDAGVEYLADIRDKPISRKPDFRATSLKALCEEIGIEYGAWPSLGSTEDQRERLRATGDLSYFHKTFRAYAKRSLKDEIKRLASVAKRRSVALMCYERSHEDCHRSTIADIVADCLNAGITAIL